ncbi:hypothetical protein ABEB36_007845 [Hypothenemus hampei]|uniref:Fatty acyl-CoA reductase n=1 Tax=Hypothenemus hampei TaxID=57062 RepID=A0ABD1EVC1_HYPHA
MYKHEDFVPTLLKSKLPKNLEIIKNGHYEKTEKYYLLHKYLQDIDIRVEENGSEIVPILKGKNILITGVTGFLVKSSVIQYFFNRFLHVLLVLIGKLLLEKLLRSCKDIGTIYIIVRTKKEKSPELRVNELLDGLVRIPLKLISQIQLTTPTKRAAFKKLAEIYPSYKEKVVGIPGDFEAVDLKISENWRKTIKSNVNIIYHMSATVRFDEKLSRAIKINIHVFAYMSTVFSNCSKKSIAEKVYEPLLDPYKVMDLVENFSEEIDNRMAPGILGDTPNTYTFTKQISEYLVSIETKGIPTCIHRPSIVISSVREPMKSWVDSIYGPVGLIIAGCLGLIHVTYGDPEIYLDFVPSDFAINSFIVSSYKVAKEKVKDTIQVFNNTTEIENKWETKKFSLLPKYTNLIGSEKLIMKTFWRMIPSYTWYLVLNFWLNAVPIYCIDFLAGLMGKPKLVNNISNGVIAITLILSIYFLSETIFFFIPLTLVSIFLYFMVTGKIIVTFIPNDFYVLLKNHLHSKHDRFTVLAVRVVIL